jgi:general secretion pathway protein D
LRFGSKRALLRLILQYVARRRSELNAIRMRTILLLACALTCAAAVEPQCCDAAPAASAAAPAERKPLTKADIDLMLREARSAIQQGRFDEANRILVRAENAHVHYSMFHFGPTPKTVRRELDRARKQPRTAGSESKSAGAAGSLDPFVARDGEIRVNADKAAPPSSQTAPASVGERDFDAFEVSQQQPPISPRVAEPMSNPFARRRQEPVAPARYETAASNRQVASSSWNQEATAASAPANSSSMPILNDEPGGDEAWGLPNSASPMASDDRKMAASSLGLAGPQQPSAEQSTSHQPEGPSLEGKQQALAQLAQARQALDAGNLELAEDLSRTAAGLGVPESQFLPDEDRPSLLAWDIERAKQNGSGARSVPARLPSVTAIPPEQLAIHTSGSPRIAAAEAAAQESLPLPSESPAPRKSSLIDTADESQQVLARQLSAEVGKRQSEAQRLRSEDPERALAILREAQTMVKDSKLPESSQRELLSRIDITLEKTQTYIKDNSAQIELDKSNAAVTEARDRDRELRLKLQQKIADLVEEFNRLRDEQRYAEAEIVARRLIELAPEDAVAQQVYQTAKFIRREMMNRQLANTREEANWNMLNDVEQSSYSNVGDGRELVYDQTRWDQLVKHRKGSKDRIDRRTERELEIERRLKTPVMLRYEKTPLSEVMDGLSQLAGVNIHLDPRGLNQEGVNSDTAVTLNLNKEISLQSALNLILEPLHLSYIVKDDVLKITSEQLRDGEIFARTYNVSDLVIPIPNFVPSNNIGLQGLINEAHMAAGYGQRGIGGNAASVLVGGGPQQQSVNANDQVLAQQFNAAPAAGMSPSTVPIGAGPGGMGAGANADFDSLIDLIVSTVSTETWAENGGGEAEIRPFPTNLSLVVSQTQAVHEEIADLLEQLRRLQDLQVTIEVRFIRLNDTFFERIGIDFDMNIEDRSGLAPGSLPPGVSFEGGTSQTVGLNQGDPFPNFTADLDVPFRQGGFASAIPPLFAGFDPNSAATFGFAILSDIEAYFLIEAAQGDSRTNVLNAPKVTLFNGQQAFVADATQRPFVVGVIPVVGEFAAAQQPVIVVLNEGTMMTIQAVVSDDRRYVRMTIVPFFTQIGDVDEFTFEGSSSTTNSSSSTDDDEDGKNEEEDESESEVRSGVTVQLPSFSFVSVVTTVSVPDGGTVLLGGIKRLSEGRNEFGVPLLSKVPYINRLFRNVAIGRETDSLMMMVTPRIIIQEEEEERLGIAVP